MTLRDLRLINCSVSSDGVDTFPPGGRDPYDRRKGYYDSQATHGNASQGLSSNGAILTLIACLLLLPVCEHFRLGTGHRLLSMIT